MLTIVILGAGGGVVIVVTISLIALFLRISSAQKKKAAKSEYTSKRFSKTSNNSCVTRTYAGLMYVTRTVCSVRFYPAVEVDLSKELTIFAALKLETGARGPPAIFFR